MIYCVCVDIFCTFKAREAVETRAQTEQKMVQKEKEKKEENLRQLAMKAREERAGIHRANGIIVCQKYLCLGLNHWFYGALNEMNKLTLTSYKIDVRLLNLTKIVSNGQI